jgi:hypothetical protein
MWQRKFKEIVIKLQEIPPKTINLSLTCLLSSAKIWIVFFN